MYEVLFYTVHAKSVVGKRERVESTGGRMQTTKIKFYEITGFSS